MVATTLTDDMIEGGRSLVMKLEESNTKVVAAFWFLFPDQHFWKLVIALDEVQTEGPKAAYQRVQKVLARLDEPRGLSLDDVGLLKPGAPLLKLMRFALRTGPGLNGIRFTNNVINGQLIPDAYVYRLH